MAWFGADEASTVRVGGPGVIVREAVRGKWVVVIAQGAAVIHRLGAACGGSGRRGLQIK